MAITMTLTEGQFVDEFDQVGRCSSFTPLARCKLFERLQDISDDIGVDIEMDVVGICCEWSEMSAQELIEAYGEAGDDFDTVFDRVSENSEIIEVDQFDTDPTYLVLEY